MITILGPTASGKTKLAVNLAARLADAEIISADSRQVYRGMDIGTGKDLSDYGEVPYHLIDICEPGTRYNVYEYQTDGGEVTWNADNGLTLADLKGVSDFDDPRWDQLIDQMDLSEALIRTAFGGTSTKTIPSISSPEAIQNDGPTGYANYPLGQYANKNKDSGDPCAIDANDPNAGFMGNTMANNVVVAQTFNKDLDGHINLLAKLLICFRKFSLPSLNSGNSSLIICFRHDIKEIVF